MKSPVRRVLTHHPGVCVAHFLYGMRGQTCDIGIPTFCRWVLACHAVTKLHQRVLNVAGMSFVFQIFAHLPVGQRAPKPSAPPKQERHEHDEPRCQEKDKTLSASHKEGMHNRRRRFARRSNCRLWISRRMVTMRSVNLQFVLGGCCSGGFALVFLANGNTPRSRNSRAAFR